MMSDPERPGTVDTDGQPDMPGPPRRPPLSARAAADVLGVNERTVRRWIDQGELVAVKVRGAYRIPPEDIDRARVMMLGGLDEVIDVTDRAGANTANQAGPDRTPGHDRTAAAAAPGSVTVSPTARAQLEAIRDEWMRPFVADIERLSRENGQLQAERDAIQRERDELAARLQTDRGIPSPPAPRPWWRFWERWG